MSKQKHDRPLIAMAEGRAQDNRSALLSAFRRIVRSRPGPRRIKDLHVRELLMYVMAVDSDGNGVQKSYAELSDQIETIERTTIDVVKIAEKEFGLLSVREQRYTRGGQAPNRFSINWTRVRAVNAGDVCQMATDGEPLSQRNSLGTEGPNQPSVPHDSGSQPGDVVRGVGDVVRGVGDVVRGVGDVVRGAFKEQSRILPEFRNTPDPVPEGPGPKPMDFRLQNSTAIAERLELEPMLGLAEHFRELPELAIGVTRIIKPLPAAHLAYGVFTPITKQDLEEIPKMLNWFKRQLSVAEPVMANTEADFLLVLCAAKYAVAIPERQVLSSRVGIFVSTITKKKWGRVLTYLPRVDAALSEFLASIGVKRC